MNWALAGLAIIGVAVLIFELLAAYINSRKLQRTEVLHYNFKLNFYRIGIVVLLELGVYITWLTHSLLVR